MDAVKMFIRMVKKLESNRVINSTTGCWLWTGKRQPNGYGRLTYQSNNHSVHRLSAHVWLDYNLDIRYNPEQVNHIRSCPNKHCFNPQHLYIGTQSENASDYYALHDTGICVQGHSKQFMYEYTSKDGKKFKWCRSCRRAANARRFQ